MPEKTIRELEETFQRLHERLLRGEMSEGEFQAEVQQLRFRDDQGHPWRLGWYTGRWYCYDQGWWSQDAPLEPSSAQLFPISGAARAAKRQHWRPITPWLVAPLVILLVLASVLLVAGWGIDGWDRSSTAMAQATTPQGASPTGPPALPTPKPTQSPPLPTLPPASATPGPAATRGILATGTTVAMTPTHTPGAADRAASTTAVTPAAVSASATAGTSAPTDTSVPPTVTPSAAASPTASPVPSRTRPTARAASPQPQKAALSGRIFFPVYDAQAARRTFDIYSVRLDSGKRELVAGQASQPAISPDGRRLAYRSWETGQQGLSVLELVDGHAWRWIDSADAARPSWSPDSQNLVFPSQQEADRRWRIYRTTGLEFAQIRRYGNDMLGRVPIWLADGRIVYWDCPLADCGLYVMRGDGADPVRLTTAEHDTGPAASPDGQQVAFMSNRSENWDIYVIDIRAPSGAEPRRLTENAARDGLPTWSPDGKWLAFVSDRGGTWAVWAMRSDGSNVQKLFDLGGAPEGKVVYAQANEQADWTAETIAWGP